MPNLTKLPLTDDEHRTALGTPSVRCVVEAPRGTSTKFKYDAELGIFVMGSALFKGLTYPHDWGFFPSTLGEDGDPLDVMVLHEGASYPGVIIPAQVIGVLLVMQTEEGKKQRNDRFFAVPVKSHRQDELNDVSQLSERTRRELEEFFTATSKLEDKRVEMQGWHGPKHAAELLAAGVKLFEKAK